MKRFVPTGAAALAAAIAASGCGGGAEAELKQTSTAQALQAQSVETARVVRKEFRPTLVSTGTLFPKRQAEIKSLVDGRLDDVPVDIGTKVRKGQRLFLVRTVDFEIGLAQAEAALARARVGLEDRRREKTRMEGLFREGSATEQMQDQAATALEDAEAAVREAEARAAMARQMLEDATIVAPYDGWVTARWQQRGEFVHKGDPVVEIMDLSTLEAEMEIPEPYAGQIEPGLEVDLSLRGGHVPAKGRVLAVNPKVDLTTRTFKVKVEVENGEKGLQAGLFCTGTFRLAERAGVAAVPASAVQRDQGASFVWIVRDGTVARRGIEEIGSTEGLVYVEGGLEEGETVVSGGAGGLYEGAAVAARDAGRG